MNDNDDVYTYFWIYLAYFFSLIFFIIGYTNNLQNYIYYAFFFLIIGLIMVVSYRLNKIIDSLQEENDQFEFYEDSD